METIPYLLWWILRMLVLGALWTWSAVVIPSLYFTEAEMNGDKRITNKRYLPLVIISGFLLMTLVEGT